jgi:hypothetical protein
MPPLRRRGIMPEAARAPAAVSCFRCWPAFPYSATRDGLTVPPRPRPHHGCHRNQRAPRATMFLFFSNKLGWGKSIAISVVLTVLLLLLLGVF